MILLNVYFLYILSSGVWESMGLLGAALFTQTILFIITFGIKIPWFVLYFNFSFFFISFFYLVVFLFHQ
jgi:hypothetical protein